MLIDRKILFQYIAQRKTNALKVETSTLFNEFIEKIVAKIRRLKIWPFKLGTWATNQVNIRRVGASQQCQDAFVQIAGPRWEQIGFWGRATATSESRNYKRSRNKRNPYQWGAKQTENKEHPQFYF